MKLFEIGGHKQIVNKDDISCSCMWSTIHPYNYKNGEKICRHIKKVIRMLNKENEKSKANKKNIRKD